MTTKRVKISQEKPRFIEMYEEHDIEILQDSKRIHNLLDSSNMIIWRMSKDFPFKKIKMKS